MNEKIYEVRRLIDDLNEKSSLIDSFSFLLEENHNELVQLQMKKDDYRAQWLLVEFERTSEHMLNIHYLLRKAIQEAAVIQDDIEQRLSKLQQEGRSL